MNNAKFYKWKSRWLLLIVLLLFSAEVFAQPPAYDKTTVLKRYAPDGTLLWEQLLPEYEPRRLVFSPNNQYAALTLQKPQKLGPDLTILRIYEEDGALIHEQ